MFEKLWHRVKTFGPALIAYWVMTFYGLVAFSAVIVITSGSFGGEMILIIGQLFLVTVVGQLVGHALGFMRPRLFIVAVFVSLGCFVQSVLLIPMSTGLTILIWFMAPFTLASGFLAIRNRTEIFGAWIPVMYSVSASVVLINADAQKLGSWMGGSKYAVWDVLNLGIISGALLLFLVYLVARQGQSLSLWQDAAQMGSEANKPSRYAGDRARVSWLSWGVVVLLAFALTVGTAAAAPFLFRTADKEEGEGKGEGKGQQQEQQEQGEGRGEPKEGDNPFEGADWDKVGEGVKEAAKQGINLLVLLLMLLIGLVLIYFVFWRPMRRLAVVRHLERPAWGVPPTQRIQDLWRRALIALHDVGVDPKGTEPVKDLAARATESLTARYGSPPTGVEEAARVYARVQYSLGVTPEDIVRMAASVDLLTQYVNNHQSWWEQLQNLYGGLKE